MNRTTIAILLTCYNRREKTLRCLQALFEQSLPSEIEVKPYLIDDGSTDGTAEAVRQRYPNVQVRQGTGSLFWNGGTRLAFEMAQADNPDYYCLLNDDTMLYPHALKTLLEVSDKLATQGNQKAIVAASTLDPDTQQPSYGGVVQTYFWHPLKFHQLNPDPEQPRRCDTFHGNCVLIPGAVAALVGNFNPAYTHNLSDHDYGLRARRQGCSIWIAPGYLGACSANPHRSRMAKSDLTGVKLEQVNRPKGFALEDVTLHSFDEWKAFCRENGGVFWLLYWLLPYRRLLWLMLVQRMSFSLR